jgi:hypothetical protein
MRLNGRVGLVDFQSEIGNGTVNDQKRALRGSGWATSVFHCSGLFGSRKRTCPRQYRHRFLDGWHANCGQNVAAVNTAFGRCQAL